MLFNSKFLNVIHFLQLLSRRSLHTNKLQTNTSIFLDGLPNKTASEIPDLIKCTTSLHVYKLLRPYPSCSVTTIHHVLFSVIQDICGVWFFCFSVFLMQTIWITLTKHTINLSKLFVLLNRLLQVLFSIYMTYFYFPMD